MAKLSQQRMGEIALILLMERLEREGGVSIGPNFRRELGNLSKKTNIPREELEEFAKVAITRMLGSAFGMQHVSLEMSDPVSKYFELRNSSYPPISIYNRTGAVRRLNYENLD